MAIFVRFPHQHERVDILACRKLNVSCLNCEVLRNHQRARHTAQCKGSK